MALFRGRGMSDPQPVEISYPDGMKEVGIVIDDDTVEGGPIAAHYPSSVTSSRSMASLASWSKFRDRVWSGDQG